MTKRKTPLQSVIEEIQDILNSRGANESNCDDYELGLIESVKILESKLPQEKQDLIDAFDEGSNATSWDSFEEAYDITPSKEEYFNQTFENER